MRKGASETLRRPVWFHTWLIFIGRRRWRTYAHQIPNVFLFVRTHLRISLRTIDERRIVNTSFAGIGIMHQIRRVIFLVHVPLGRAQTEHRNEEEDQIGWIHGQTLDQRRGKRSETQQKRWVPIFSSKRSSSSLQLLSSHHYGRSFLPTKCIYRDACVVKSARW